MDVQKSLDHIARQFPESAVFEVAEWADTELDAFLSSHVSPRSFWLHSHIGGAGWQIFNVGHRKQVVVISDKKLATFLRLKLS